MVHLHVAQLPPDRDDTTHIVAALLLANVDGPATVASIRRALKRRGITVSKQAVQLAYQLASKGTAVQPRMRGRSDVMRAQRRMEAFYRAAYIVNASRRLDATLGTSSKQGKPSAQRARGRAALQREKPYWQAHERARRGRLDAAGQAARAEQDYGPTLGWYTHKDDRTTPECRAAGGTNFPAARPPLIGYPGQPHGGTCRCRSGPPHTGGRDTDTVTRGYIAGAARPPRRRSMAG